MFCSFGGIGLSRTASSPNCFRSAAATRATAFGSIRWSSEFRIRQRELMNVPEALKRPGIDGCHFVGRDADEVMNRIANLVLVFGHG
jgi:hypothetical protein